MKPLYKIFIAGAVVALLIGGGAFLFLKQKDAQTVFEVEKEKQDKTNMAPEIQPEPVEIIAPQEERREDSEEKKITSEEGVKKEEEKEMPKEESSGDVVKKFTLKSSLVSFGHESASKRKIDTIVLHSSYNPSGDPYSVSAVKGIWQSYGVAPHYMVARDGTVYQLVADTDIAYHAGESVMKDGRKNVNDFSIGVEILNTKEDEYTKAQYQAVKDLISYLKNKHSIKYVVGHDDIAPGRKTDPWNFDWNKL